jgi:hypothetical protein
VIALRERERERERESVILPHPLASESKRFIMAYLMNGVATNWVSIGLLLGIPYKRMEIFKLEDTLEERMGMMVDAWLSLKHDVAVFGEPTWRRLVEVVASSSGGGHMRLATEIARDHPLCYTGKVECVGYGGGHKRQ